jgi:hypothetical protein
MHQVLRLSQGDEHWVPIFMGYYELNPDGRVRRVAPARGTFPGRELKPYKPKGGRYTYVKLHGQGRVVQMALEILIESLFHQSLQTPEDHRRVA